MKNKIISLFTLFVLSMLITSCAINSGYINSSASLSSANFKYVKLAKGSSETSKFLGLGGLEVDMLLANAKSNMFENYPLKDNQTYANFCVDFLNSNILYLVKKQKVTITADIVEFTK
jgi:hypothetical protein